MTSHIHTAGKESIRVVHSAYTLAKEIGGPAVSIRRLSEALADRAGVQSTLCSYLERPDQVETMSGNADIRRGRLGGVFHAGRDHLRDLLALNPDVIHCHGLWAYHSLAVLRWHRRTRKPYVVSIRGMLEPWALRRSSAKKKIALFLYQKAHLKAAACLVASSEVEAVNIRAAGFAAPICVLPNGVKVPEVPVLEKNPLKPSEIRTALFFSRIHPVKGLMELLAAWKQAARPGWRLMIAGPDEDGYLRQVVKTTGDLALCDSVVFEQPRWGEQKFDLHRTADLFVLPSHSENFGIAIAEALAVGLPVVTSQATPWEGLVPRQCGWWHPNGIEPLANALAEAMALSDAQRHAMGLRGREWMRESFSWEQIARETHRLYNWVLGRAPLPPSVAIQS